MIRAVRSWQERTDRRVIMTSDGPIFAERGEVVVVLVADNWERAAEFVAFVNRESERGSSH